MTVAPNSRKTRSPAYAKSADVNQPWIVSLTDFRRNTYRAIRVVAGTPSRVLCFYVRRIKRNDCCGWVILYSTRISRAQLRNSLRRFMTNDARTVSLSDLPPLSPRR